CVQIIDEMLHLLVRQLAKSKGHDAQIRRVQRFHSGDIGLSHWINGSISGIDREKHRALEPMAHRQDFSQHRQALLRTIFFVAAQQNDLLSFAGSTFALINNPIFGQCAKSDSKQQCKHSENSSFSVHAPEIVELSAAAKNCKVQINSKTKLEL